MVAVLALVLTVAGWRTRRDLRAGLLAAAAGVGYGLTGVFFSTAASHLDVGGIGAVVGAWQTWASVATGVASFYLLQNAVAAGRLVVVEPGVTLANPLVATTWGVVVFGESAAGGTALIGVGTGVALVTAGVVVLGASPRCRDPVRLRSRWRPGDDRISGRPPHRQVIVRWIGSNQTVGSAIVG